MKKNNLIAYAAAKSGGHIIPCLTLAKEYKQNNPDAQILFFTSRIALDTAIITQSQLVNTHVRLPISHAPKQVKEYILFFPFFVWSFIRACYYFIQQRPTFLLTTGGMIALPVCFAAWITRIPIHLFCLDAQPGKTLRLLQPFAHIQYSAFAPERTPRRKITIIHKPYPITYTSAQLKEPAPTARALLGLHPHKKTLCILGGSQGSIFINKLIISWLQQYTERAQLQIIHQTGSNDTTEWHTIYPALGVSAYVFSFRANLSSVYAAADIIIARAGAGTLWEIKAFNKKAIIIPLYLAHNHHQMHNAQAIAAAFPRLFTIFDQQSIVQDPIPFFNHLNKQVSINSIHLAKTMYNYRALSF